MKSPTYAEIATEVERIGGFVPKTCWITHIKSDLGLTTRMASNRIAPRKRKHPCPPEKRPVILEALRKLGVV
ncbi:MAG: hypothetical protein LC114_05775 [Bryobacterales bacterium]|nr:hypothetical protein [Bryobacterales bacterium]